VHGLKLVGGKLVGRELVVAASVGCSRRRCAGHEGGKLLGGSPAGVERCTRGGGKTAGSRRVGSLDRPLNSRTVAEMGSFQGSTEGLELDEG
jgi:hypothetical protein